MLLVYLYRHLAMAQRKFSIPGKLINSQAGTVFNGPTGQFAWGGDVLGAPGQIHQTSDMYIGENASLKGIFSCWFWATSTSNSDSNILLHLNNEVGTEIYNEFGFSAGRPVIFMATETGGGNASVRVDVQSTTAFSASTWTHLLVSWDLTSGNTFADDFHMYMNDVDTKPGSPDTFTVGSEIEWGGNIFDETGLNARLSLGNTQALTDDAWRMAAWYLNTSEYLDFSVTANRRKFIDGDGLPVALGVDGSFPTGSQPLCYFDDPVATLLNNRGFAGTFILGTNVVLVDVTGPNP